LVAINISNLFLAFKYVKHSDLGQKLRSTFQSNINFKIMVNQAFQTKWHYQSSIKNKILCLDITSIHKSLNRLLPIPKDRISHTWWLFQTGRARKEDYECFSLTAATSRVSNTSYPPNWITIHLMVFSSQFRTLGLCLKPHLFNLISVG